MRKAILEISYYLKYQRYFKVKKQLSKNLTRTINDIENEQLYNLKKMIEYCAKFVPFYKENYEAHISSFLNNPSFESLDNFPIITKDIVTEKHTKFMSLEKRRYVTSSTGGSTGVTLKYLLDLETTFYGRIINDRGWGLAGYKPGDRIVIFAGGSLVGKMNFVKKLKYFLSNKKAVSTYGITVDDMHKLSMYINKKKVLYMYGYASSIYFFAVFLKENNIKIYNKLHGVFCTSEKLFPHQRTIINEMIGEVFDDYGLNDGGVSAHECTEHDGLHIDTERSILEVVDENGSRIKDGIGRIIATDLRNMSMPLIRYDTGDLGKITYNECKCGLKTPRLIEIIGRVTDYLLINGVYIGSPALTVLMGKLNLKMYQIIQQEKDKIVFKIVLNNNTIEEKKYCVNFITKSINEHVKDAIINFRFYDKIEDLNITNKYKFIINETI